MAILLPFYITHPSFGSGNMTGFRNVLSSVLLVSDGSTTPILAVSWTLFHEIMFYALFGLAIINRFIGGGALILWTTLSLFNADFHFDHNNYFLSPLHFIFAMGMLASIGLRGRAVPAWLLTVTGIMLFISIAIDEVYCGYIPTSMRALAYGAASTIAMLGMARLELERRIKFPKALLVVGDASYAIYLVHYLVLSAMAKIIVIIEPTHMPKMPIFIFMALFSVFFGCAVHIFVETPLISYFRSKSFVRKDHGRIAAP